MPVLLPVVMLLAVVFSTAGAARSCPVCSPEYCDSVISQPPCTQPYWYDPKFYGVAICLKGPAKGACAHADGWGSAACDECCDLTRCINNAYAQVRGCYDDESCYSKRCPLDTPYLCLRSGPDYGKCSKWKSEWALKYDSWAACDVRRCPCTEYCTAEQCKIADPSSCSMSNKFLCSTGKRASKCAEWVWPEPESCSTCCDYRTCLNSCKRKCTPDECKETCPKSFPYMCQKGTNFGVCVSDPYYWPTNPARCSTCCDTSLC